MSSSLEVTIPYPRCSRLQEIFNKFAEVGLSELEEASYYLATEGTVREYADRHFLEHLKLATLRLISEHHATPPIGFSPLSYKEEWKLYRRREAVQRRLAHIESTFTAILDHHYAPLPPQMRRAMRGYEPGSVEITVEIYGVLKPTTAQIDNGENVNKVTVSELFSGSVQFDDDSDSGEDYIQTDDDSQSDDSIRADDDAHMDNTAVSVNNNTEAAISEHTSEGVPPVCAQADPAQAGNVTPVDDVMQMDAGELTGAGTQVSDGAHADVSAHITRWRLRLRIEHRSGYNGIVLGHYTPELRARGIDVTQTGLFFKQINSSYQRVSWWDALPTRDRKACIVVSGDKNAVPPPHFSINFGDTDFNLADYDLDPPEELMPFTFFWDENWEHVENRNVGRKSISMRVPVRDGVWLVLNDVKAELLRRTTFTLSRGPQMLLRRCDPFYDTKFLEVHWDVPIPIDSREKQPEIYIVCPECYQFFGKRTPYRTTHM